MNTTRTQHGSQKRRGGLLAAVVVSLGLLVAACGPTEPAPPAGAPTAPPDAITSTVFNRTNADRAANGLATLTWNARLAGLAGEWARYLADTGQFRHRDLGAALNSPGYETYNALGENILVGPTGIDGNAMHTAWMNSPTHLHVIMGNWDSVGIALANGTDGNVRAVANYGRH